MTPPVRFALVPGPGGSALVASRGERVVASFLPGRRPRDLVRLLRARFPDAAEAPGEEVAGAGEMARWLGGEPAAVAGVPVALDGVPPFAAKVYAELRKVPPGATLTYGDLAARAGSPGAARAVGRAMATNPLAPFVPCHRVVGAGGALTGFSAPGGTDLKARLLAREARAKP
jgi:methylated-DNA-[protein]-cysteine S-methyltransferase